MLRLKVEGMGCGHCVGAVTRAVQGLDPAAAVRVDLEAGTVEAQTRADPAAVSQAITAAGYKAQAL
ncbi:MAG: heavy-metal-associated domain-containing protein [Phenylobacterium sp.]|jgi:copper chaperone|uniref:heavy-metal-associated domain-containing protein n=1 Tax=Phenylobacterium sp. TaxID=1871053 RepID=UPI001A572926|nr:heavy-metal-associated domain-containing protein [Phenylobacterium sp.]MBL8772398.1 heavy-metal-associated domain-containing protein [Phenylobacterium sp.]